MAKKTTGLEDLFKKTEPAAGGDQVDLSRLDEGRIMPIGVGLKTGEARAIESIGRELGNLLGTEPVSRNALMHLAIRSFLESYLSGNITLQELAENFERPEKPRARRKR